jgi:hypothetical protein
MPCKQDASYAAWKIWFERHLEFLYGEPILIGYYKRKNLLSWRTKYTLIIVISHQNIYDHPTTQQPTPRHHPQKHRHSTGGFLRLGKTWRAHPHQLFSQQSKHQFIAHVSEENSASETTGRRIIYHEDRQRRNNIISFVGNSPRFFYKEVYILHHVHTHPPPHLHILHLPSYGLAPRIYRRDFAEYIDHRDCCANRFTSDVLDLATLHPKIPQERKLHLWISPTSSTIPTLCTCRTDTRHSWKCCSPDCDTWTVYHCTRVNYGTLSHL